MAEMFFTGHYNEIKKKTTNIFTYFLFQITEQSKEETELTAAIQVTILLDHRLTAYNIEEPQQKYLLGVIQ